METILANYLRCIRTVSDIYEHLPKLLELSVKCESIAEMGVRDVVSTWAFLYGLCLNQKQQKHLVCVDLYKPSCLYDLQILSASCGIEFEFHQGNSASMILPVVDMMFIDTWHVYAHLKRELEFHHPKVRKYIVLHDTEVDKIIGESIREGLDIDKQCRDYGYPRHEIMMGLSFAVEEFLEKHPEWKLNKHYPNNNGLTILERITE